MGSVSARVSDDLEAEVEAYIDAEKLDRSTAIRRRLEEGLEDWRREAALSKFEDGGVSLTRAADLADMDAWAFATLARERDVTWVAGEHLADDLTASHAEFTTNEA